MKIDNSILKSEERVILTLRNLYRVHGYSYFKMSKFEEYDLYGQNKEFLVSDSVITFTDTNGKLMALKPDVTLSIVKNSVDIPGNVRRFYYNENVYRISEKTRHYKEIMQTGLECIGDLTAYNLCEVVRLAAESLQQISNDCVLNISHLGVVSAVLKDLDLGVSAPLMLKCLKEKNPHGIAELCKNQGISPEKTEFLSALTSAYGEPDKVIETLKQKTASTEILNALDELRNILSLCGKIAGVSIRVDFSLINDINYYNGLIFQGYVNGIPSCVLSGGQYDHLMKKMGKHSRAIGFAVYLDLLERLEKENDYDVDVLLLYDKDTDPKTVLKRTEELISGGKSVAAQVMIPEKLRYRDLETLGKKERTL